MAIGPCSSLSGPCLWCLIKESNNHMQKPLGEEPHLLPKIVCVCVFVCVCVCLLLATITSDLWSVTIEDNEGNEIHHTLSSHLLNLIPAIMLFPLTPTSGSHTSYCLVLLCLSSIFSSANFLPSVCCLVPASVSLVLFHGSAFVTYPWPMAPLAGLTMKVFCLRFLRSSLT